MAPNWSSQLSTTLGVDIEGIDVGAIHMVPEPQTGTTGGSHSLRDEAGRVIGSSWTGGFNEHVVSRGITKGVINGWSSVG